MCAEREQKEAMAKIEPEKDRNALKSDRLNFDKQKFEKICLNNDRNTSDGESNLYTLY